MQIPGDIPEILRGPVLRWWERASASAAFLDGYRALPDERRAELARVVAASEFAASALIHDPPALAWVAAHWLPAAAAAANAGWERTAAAAPTASEAMTLLRRWRRREMLRLAWRDIAGTAAVRETLEGVSALAEACIRAAHEAARVHLSRIFGEPRAAATAAAAPALLVIGMGKLGGNELNFSSDVDLVLLFDGAGETSGPRSIDNEEYFTRLGRELIRMLDARTEEGFVFRVDVRLRPFGDSGPPVVSLAALEDYLQQHGRDWERYAWVKARAIVGRERFESTHREFVRPFVYRRYLDFGVFESLREMKALIAREVARRDRERDLKLGEGGIREIEFIVQSLQLVRGGSDARLQCASLLEVLPLLNRARSLSSAAVEELTAAYTLLRKAENAVQMIRDEQLHSLPQDAADRERVRLNMGLSAWSAAAQRIEGVRRGVARHFEALLLGGPETQRRPDEETLGWLDAADSDPARELERAGFPAAEIPAVALQLGRYRRAAPYRRLDDAGRRRLRVILERLLSGAVTYPAPATVIERVLRVLDAIGARSSYLALLKEQPPALARLIEVCAFSGFLARQIADFPLLLDELIDPKAFDDLPSREGFVRELEARTERLTADDPERQVEALRAFQKAAVFSTALADLTGRMPLMRVSDRLTDIAELIVQCCMRLAWQQMTSIHGVPLCGESLGTARPVAVAAAGYGKLGGWELGYASDLDLVFLHDSSGEHQQTDGARPVDNSVFFLRLGQRIVHLLTMHSAAGRLYEVDMRLRPNGKGGFLMTGIDAFERYQHREAWTWEHQALLRARAVGGDAALCRRFESIRTAALCGAVRRGTLRTDVPEMRKRMRRELAQPDPARFDIKQDAGGIADIEFLVQYWVLASAAAHPELIVHSDNIRQLEALARARLVEAETAEWLKESYVGYRTMLHHLSLEGGERVVEAAPWAATRARILAIWRNAFESAEN